jgi:hypothetical protein
VEPSFNHSWPAAKTALQAPSTFPFRSILIAQKLDEKVLVSFKEILKANSKIVDALAQVL